MPGCKNILLPKLTSKTMEVFDALVAKQKLEKEVKKLLVDFEVQSGLTIKSVELKNAPVYEEHEVLTKVFITAVL